MPDAICVLDVLKEAVIDIPVAALVKVAVVGVTEAPVEAAILMEEKLDAGDD